MCGILGIVGKGVNREQLAPGLEALAHRGPDDFGSWADTLCALGHRRLSIIDLSPAGHQPMADESGGLWITFNGEIYNFLELRRELEQFGHRFHSRTDTEVILYAYRQWGTDCVRRLRGMFAFAIWDQAQRRLFMAVDRVGKKPLYFGERGGRLYFASEMQGLLAVAPSPHEVEPRSVDAYLSWGYVPAPHTIFAGISKLPPAHWATVDVVDGGLRTHTERYWSLSYTPKLTLSDAEAAEALREKLREAVRLRLISDVPLGVFLSGGIDSSIVVGLMAQVSDQPVKTFSIGFNEPQFNETAHARRIAQLWSTDHHEFIVEPNAIDILPMLVRHFGEPYADSSALPTYYVSRMTRTAVTVALNGDGGDENFAGYARYAGLRLGRRLDRFPGIGVMGRVVSRVLPDSLNPSNRVRNAKRFLAIAHWPLARRYAQWVSQTSEETKNALYRPEFRALLNGSNTVTWIEKLFAAAGDLDPTESGMCVDVQSYLPFDLLAKVDRTSMANSLEARSPFLDHEVMEFAARLPAHLKLHGRASKYLLKSAFADLLPRANVDRRKMGFGVPVGHWFYDPLKPLLGDLTLPNAAIAAYVDPRAVQQLVDAHLAGKANNTAPLWTLLMLELWHRFVAQAKAVAA